MLKIRKANIEDKMKVINLYKLVIEQIKDNEYNPEWIYGIYPKEKNITEPLEVNEVIVGEIDSEIVSAMVVNHISNEGYDTVEWNVDTSDDNVFFVHLVAVNQNFRNRGIAKEMLRYVFNMAENESVKSIRLSLNVNNLGIENLYLKQGFEYVDSITVFIKDRGLKTFNVYEKIISS
ncbi:MAG: hypothetical protein BZ135_00390 [Methanosphaera sp. rholeuAM6]|nr:MAG: hypothetical protein BZ135_00390 [Methanosphaera sp. rholeuAM6]